MQKAVFDWYFLLLSARGDTLKFGKRPEIRDNFNSCESTCLVILGLSMTNWEFLTSLLFRVLGKEYCKNLRIYLFIFLTLSLYGMYSLAGKTTVLVYRIKRRPDVKKHLKLVLYGGKWSISCRYAWCSSWRCIGCPYVVCLYTRQGASLIRICRWKRHCSVVLHWRVEKLDVHQGERPLG